MKFLRSWKFRFLLFFAIVGPGFITANVDNDSGGIFTYSAAGAQFGTDGQIGGRPSAFGSLDAPEFSTSANWCSLRGLLGMNCSMGLKEGAAALRIVGEGGFRMS